MKLISGEAMKVAIIPYIRTKTFQLYATKGKDNLIDGFHIEIFKTKKKEFIPVLKGQYMEAFTKVCNKLKPHLK